MRKFFVCALLSGFLLGSAFVQGDEVDFEKEIYPFIKMSCVKCHRPAYEETRGSRTRLKKPKAGIVLSTKEGFLSAEGESGAKILVPGDPDKSRILEVTLLPLDDEMHFPPEGKAPQLTKAEKELFAKWIKEGANFGSWTEDPKPGEGLEWDGKEKE